MANQVLNIALGAIAEKIRDGANIQVILIASSGVESDATLKDKDTVADFVSGATNEATNTNGGRKSISNGSVTLTVNDTLDRVEVDIADQTWAALANDGTGAVSDILIAEDVGGADSSRVPLTMHDFSITPDGSDVTAQVADFHRAS
jgi:hypothetical protein